MGKNDFLVALRSRKLLSIPECQLAMASMVIFSGCLVLYRSILTPKESSPNESWSDFYEEKTKS